MQHFHLKARLLCHDIRLNCWVETTVALDRAPTPAEAERLLWPAADALVARHDCDECPYELSDVSITPTPGAESVTPGEESVTRTPRA